MSTAISKNWLKLFPSNRLPSFFLWTCFSSAVGLTAVLLATHVFKDYGFTLFCGVPLAMGIIAPLGHGLGARRSFLDLFWVNLFSQLALLAGMLAFGIEGMGCMVMCAPLWLIIALGGTAIVYPIVKLIWNGQVSGHGFPVVGLLLILSLPLWMGAEHAAHPEPPLLSVTTSVDIDAPPVVVWQSVITFPQLPPPRDWIFNLGIAYPEHAVIIGHGPGAVRHCIFSTGAFIEPIRVWEDAKLLAFDVVQSPPSMNELSPYPDIHPEHLEGYMVSRKGQFELIDLGNGRTRLQGTTWYQNRMFPVAYWRLWSDTIVHKIHLEVLNHVKALSEVEAKRRLTSAHPSEARLEMLPVRLERRE